MGCQLIDPKGRELATELEKISDSFKPIHYGSDHQRRIDIMMIGERRAAAQTLAKGLTKSRNIFKTIEELRQFTSAQSISSLNSWSQKNGSYCRLHIKISDRQLYIGPDVDNLKRFMLQDEYFRALAPLPNFGKLQTRRVA